MTETVARQARTEDPASTAPTAFTAPTAPAPTAGSTLACPECGTMATVTLSRRDSMDFCRACDYPMFWARPEQPAEGSAETGDGARRRAPGASGTETLATVPCPQCGERNLPAAWLCVRCDASMIPTPPPAPAPIPMPEPVVEPVPPREQLPAAKFPWWWFAAMAAIGGGLWLGTTVELSQVGWF